MTTTKDIMTMIDVTSRSIYFDSAFCHECAKLGEDNSCDIELILMYANDFYYPEYTC